MMRQEAVWLDPAGLSTGADPRRKARFQLERDTFTPMVGLTELLLIYLLPAAVFVALWFLLAVLLYALVRFRVDVDLRYDLTRKYDDKQGLRSIAGQRFSAFYLAKLLAGDNCIQAVVLYRFSRFLIVHRLRLPAQALHAFSKFLTNLDIAPGADIGRGVYFYHGLGIVIGKRARIGRRALICQGVSIGGATIGEDVKLWAGAKIVGNVTIGDRSEVGANSVVIENVPPDSIVFGVPARLAGKSQGPKETKPAASPSVRARDT
jgi:serine acetyltransferase